MRIKSRKYKNIDRIIRLCCITGALFAYSSTAYATIAVGHNSLPVLDRVLHGTVTVPDLENIQNSTMNITQTGTNAVIKWQDFSIGTNATVNFSEANNNSFNVLNYVDSGVISQIYGNLNATNGNVFLVNTAGALISKSAEINVGSLYVSNRRMSDDQLSSFYTSDTPIVNGTLTSAELMNLGHVKANKVTFDGERVVLDLDYLKKTNEDKTVSNLEAKDIIVKTTDVDNVVIGYTAYDENGKTYAGRNPEEKDGKYTDIATVMVGVKEDDTYTYTQKEHFTQKDGYMWVKDVEQLQAIETNKSGNYALKNSIDAIATKDWQGDDNTPANFVAIGTEANPFKGKFDGLDNNIFGLTVTKNKNKTDTNVGLFGVAENATIRNVDMIAGSVTGTQNVGSIVGKAIGGEISNITTSMEVKGTFIPADSFAANQGTNQGTNVGGIVGYADGVAMSQLDNVGTVQGKANVGGIAGYMEDGELAGGSFNMGYVKGQNALTYNDTDKQWSTDNGNQSSNVGGLVGYAQDAILGKENEEAIANKMEVSGGYNVGGIVGRYVNSVVITNKDNSKSTDIVRIVNAVNSGDITATGSVDEDYYYYSDHSNGTKIKSLMSVDVKVANVGGIVGNISATYNENIKDRIKISDLHNTGNIQSNKGANNDYYDAGNVGGIAGRVSGVDVDDAYNDENKIRGAHNIGGIAGFVEKATVSNATNTSDVLGTGARNGSSFVKEKVRKDGSEEFIVGNIGGIVGYLYGDTAYVNTSGNRGYVHTEDVSKGTASEAANLGGVVGKINRNSTVGLNVLQNNPNKAAVKDVFNTGVVQGYTGIGGIIGQMYNGEVTTSHNSGNIYSTRTADLETTQAINLGGIVGDSTEDSTARALIYDVYNKGLIGDSSYTYFGRHVGGIVGRLSGDVIKSYNVGDIFNGANVVGGIAGYWFKGELENVFNTGNITVVSKDTAGTQVGGLAGAGNVAINELNVNYAYNIGTIRSFAYGGGHNSVGGVVGGIVNYNGDDYDNPAAVNVDNFYVLGNIYAAKTTDADWKNTNFYRDNSGYINAIYGKEVNVNTTENIENSFYIAPKDTNLFSNLPEVRLQGVNSIAFENRGDSTQYSNNGDGFLFGNTFAEDADNKIIYDVNTSEYWRIYKDEYGTTMPILNAFMPSTEAYFSNADNLTNISDVQYGTAYDPLLTIVTIKSDVTSENKNLTVNWTGDNGLNGGDHTSIAVHNGGLTINNFDTNNKLFGGLLYADGALSINSSNQDIKIGSCSDIYGASVNINANSKDLVIYGNVTATGNGGVKGDVVLNGNNIEIIGAINSAMITNNPEPISGVATGLDDNANFDKNNNLNVVTGHMSHIGDLHSHNISNSTVNGDVTITADNNVDILLGVGKQGLLSVPGDLSIKAGNNIYVDSDIVLGSGSNVTFTAPGEIVLDISNIGVTDDGYSETSKGTYVQGFITHFNNSDKKLTFQTDEQHKGISNVIIALDMWNEKKDSGAGYDAHLYDVDTGSTDENDEIVYNHLGDTLSALKITKDGQTSVDKDKDGTVDDDEYITASDFATIWISNAKQLEYLGNIHSETGAGIHLLESNFALKNDINANHIVGFNGIGDISVDTDGTLNGINYNGVFDGRGYSIVGLDIKNNDNNIIVDGKNYDYGGRIGIFNTIGAGGVVKNLKVYHSDIQGGAVGAVAGVNYGTIENVYTFGNKIESTGIIKVQTGDENGDPVYNYWGSAGGVAGINVGIIKDSDSNNIVIAGRILDKNDNGTVVDGNTIDNNYYQYEADSLAGGVTGFNVGTIQYAVSDSALTASRDANSLGGIAGVSTSSVVYDKDGEEYKLNAVIEGVESYGVVNGTYNGANTGNDATANHVGGIVGSLMNGASITGAYNEAEIIGANRVGGIVGFSGHGINLSGDNAPDNNITNVINSGSIDGKNYVGGLIGYSAYTEMDGARNTGEITGEDYVGGIVGSNKSGSTMNNIVNDNKASITGIRYVGGVAGQNEGIISADSMHLDNNGELYGKQYVGGIVGENKGVVNNTINDIKLNVNIKDIWRNKNTGVYSYDEKNGEDWEKVEAQFFGGVVGNNTTLKDNDGNAIKITDSEGNQFDTGTIINAENRGNVNADGANYVGGIVGYNDGSLQSVEVDGKVYIGNANSGIVSGNAYVGGVGGYNKDSVSGTADNMVLIQNNGTVTATQGGAAGIWGYNEGSFEYVEMINNGSVTGAAVSGTSVGGTGGIIGTNTGEIEHSTLMNNANASVSGVNDVGGLIGINSGNITGGRDEGYNYYKYHISNNGNIKGDGNNVGGLIGRNTGSITAAYNTGSVTGKENVGGIVGSNAGTVDQVFSVSAKTIKKVEGVSVEVTNTIAGTSNVGGLIGNNSGKLTDSYNSSEMGTTGTNIGNAVGSNAGTINNVYATNNSGKLIGVGSDWRETSTQDNAQNNTQSEPKVTNVYSYVAGDDSAKVIGSNDRNNIVSYKGFYALSGEETDQTITVNNEWKAYDGQTNPLLKVFLTKAVFEQNSEGFEYDAYTHELFVKADGDVVKVYANYVGENDKSPIEIGVINTLSQDSNAAHSLADYLNTKGTDGISNLIVANSRQFKNVGEYDTGLYSQQINTNGKVTNGVINHNNLGFDIEDSTVNVKKAIVDLNLNKVTRTYGNVNGSSVTTPSYYIMDAQSNDTIYGYSYSDNINAEMIKELEGTDNSPRGITFGSVGLGYDQALVSSDRTNNAGGYKWNVTATLTDDAYKNYEFVNFNGVKVQSNRFHGTSIVKKAELTVTLADVVRIYGQSNLKNGYEYTIVETGLVNGDNNYNDIILSERMKNLTTATSS